MKSMTGYGRATARTERYEITAEVHSVNHRFLETSVRLPRSFSYLEEKLKEQVQQKISRGKVEVTLTMQTIGAKSTVVEINHDVVTAYLQAVAAENALLRESGFRRNQIMLGTAADENGNATDALPLSTLLRIPDAFQVQQVADDPDVIWSEVQPVMAEALQQFVAMRETEGKRLADDVAFHLDRLAEMTDAVEKLVPETVQQYYENQIMRNCHEKTILGNTRCRAKSMAAASGSTGSDSLPVLCGDLSAKRGCLRECQTPVGRAGL